jgi:hypothetical protein
MDSIQSFVRSLFKKTLCPFERAMIAAHRILDALIISPPISRMNEKGSSKKAEGRRAISSSLSRPFISPTETFLKDEEPTDLESLPEES